jgi:Protein of unknown function (DUF1203)
LFKIKNQILSITLCHDLRRRRNSVPEFRRCEAALTPYASVMKNSTFRIVPLATEVAATARGAAASGAPDHAVVAADSLGGFPCRHCLRYARSGERMILFPYAAIPAGHPYSESGPIFVHAEPCERYRTPDEYPADFRNGRVMRAYNSNYDMIDAQIVNGSTPEAIIEKFLQKPETAFVDVRSVTHGCYTFRIQRL